MSKAFIIDHILFFGRNYDEVLALFALNEKDLMGKRVLDCNSGPDGFVSEARNRGFDVVGCDPLYAKSRDEITAQGEADIAHSAQRSKDTAGDFDLEAFFKGKREALTAFTDGYDAGKANDQYIAGELPNLPFPDDHFDIVLSAHFLFISSPPAVGGMIDGLSFGKDFHQAAVRELVRVSRGQVRIFPFNRIGKSDILHPWAVEIMGELAQDGHEIAIADNSYDQGSYTSQRTLIINKKSS